MNVKRPRSSGLAKTKFLTCRAAMSFTKNSHPGCGRCLIRKRDVFLATRFHDHSGINSTVNEHLASFDEVQHLAARHKQFVRYS